MEAGLNRVKLMKRSEKLFPTLAGKLHSADYSQSKDNPRSDKKAVAIHLSKICVNNWFVGIGFVVLVPIHAHTGEQVHHGVVLVPGLAGVQNLEEYL